MRIFITRPIQRESLFFQGLQKLGFELHGESLLHFTPIPFSQIPFSDWIFFYSSKAVHFFFTQAKNRNLPLPKNVRLAAIGTGTAKTLKQYGHAVDFVGTGHPMITAYKFEAEVSGQKVLFPRAEHSRKSVQDLLNDKIQVIDLIVYKNEPRVNIELPDCDVLIFTSPLNAAAYFSKYSVKPTQKIIAIGSSTAQALKGFEINEIFIPEQPSEEKLLKLIETLAL